jgi:ABC-type sugar transport system ATPase subunit
MLQRGGSVPSDAPVLTMSNVSKSFGGVKALVEASLTL